MSGNPKVVDELDDILDGVHEELESGASADRIRELADEHPAARSEILDFAAAWFTSQGSDLSDDDLVVDQTVSDHVALLERFWRAMPSDAADPFQSLPTEDLEMLARRCRIDMGILRQLVRRLIDEATIPGKLVAWLADATVAPMSDVWFYLSSSPAHAADYYAPKGKRTGAKVSFAEAVRGSALDPDDRQFWLSHLDA